MLTTRMSPKMSVKPEATTKYSAAAVTPFSSVMRKSFGSSTAGPKLVLVAMNTTHTIGSTMARTKTARSVRRNARCDASTLIPRRRYPRPRRDARALSRIEDVAPGLPCNVGDRLDLEAGAGDRQTGHLYPRAGGPRGPRERPAARGDSRGGGGVGRGHPDVP